LHIPLDFQKKTVQIKTSEHKEQCALIQRCEIEAKTDPRYGQIFAIPNGGYRHPGVARKLKAEGVKPGVPDLFLPVPSRNYHGLFIEMKVKPNRPTGTQLERLRQLHKDQYCVGVCYSFEQAFQLIQNYLQDVQR